MTDLAGPLAAFLQEHLPRDRGASPHTVAGYAASFKLLAVFAAERHQLRPCRLQVGHLDIPTLLAFLNHLETDRDNGVRTRNARLSAIKSFFRYLEFRHPECLDLAAQVHALPQKKADLPPLDYLDRDEVRALLDAPATHTVTGLRGSRHAVPGLQCRPARLGTGRLGPGRPPGTGTRPHPDPGQGPPRSRPAAVEGKPATRYAPGSVSGRTAPTSICS